MPQMSTLEATDTGNRNNIIKILLTNVQYNLMSRAVDAHHMCLCLVISMIGSHERPCKDQATVVIDDAQ